MGRVLRFLVVAALTAVLPLSAYSPANADQAGAPGMGPGCPLPRITPLAQKIFGSYETVFHVSGSGGIEGAYICRFNRASGMLYVALHITERAPKVFEESQGSMSVRQSGSATLGEQTGHVIGYRRDKMIDVRWIVLPSGASNPAVPGQKLEPIAMALLCDGKAAC